MPNIYRVISMSLAVSLFFAAPLLCVSPISVQLKKARKVASKESQAERARVVQQRASHRHIRKEARAAAWARATHQFLIDGSGMPLTDEKQISTPTRLFDEGVASSAVAKEM